MQSAGLGQAGRLPISIQRCDEPSARWKARIKTRLIGDLEPDEWDLPPKPKWMRWATYNRQIARYDRYEQYLDYGLAELAAKLGKKFFL